MKRASSYLWTGLICDRPAASLTTRFGGEELAATLEAPDSSRLGT